VSGQLARQSDLQESVPLIHGGSANDEIAGEQWRLGPEMLQFLPGGGWSYGSTPIMFYDWKSEDWTIPLNFVVSRTLKFGNTPVKLEMELN